MKWIASLACMALMICAQATDAHQLMGTGMFGKITRLSSFASPWPSGTGGDITLPGAMRLEPSAGFVGKVRIVYAGGGSIWKDNLGAFLNDANNDSVCKVDFASLSIPLGTSLDIGVGCKWAMMGVSGNASIIGKIIGRTGVSGTYKLKAPDGQRSYTASVGSGGAGGSSGAGNYVSIMKLGLVGSAGLAGRGGNGANSAYVDDNAPAAAGGAGGDPGIPGQGIYLVVAGALSGTGEITVAGTAGGNGAPGQDGITHDSACGDSVSGGSGAGGGGGGGSGGTVVIKAAVNTFSPLGGGGTGTITFTGAAGGAGGTPPGYGMCVGDGDCRQPLCSTDGSMGQPGIAGLGGSSIVNTWP